MAERNVPEAAKSGQSLRSGESAGVGHWNKIGQFFHVKDKGNRRKSSVRETPFIFTRRKSMAPDGNKPFLVFLFTFVLLPSMD